MNSHNTYAVNYQGVKNKNEKEKMILVRLITAAAVVLVLSLIFVSIFSLIGAGENSSNFIKHEIKHGESLWSIAAHYYDSNNVDLRKIIYQIKQVNNIDSSVINPGKELIIPIN
jgi:LysM repeat protein